jgi:hypothetical protein
LEVLYRIAPDTPLASTIDAVVPPLAPVARFGKVFIVAHGILTDSAGAAPFAGAVRRVLG